MHILLYQPLGISASIDKRAAHVDRLCGVYTIDSAAVYSDGGLMTNAL